MQGGPGQQPFVVLRPAMAAMAALAARAAQPAAQRPGPTISELLGRDRLSATRHGRQTWMPPLRMTKRKYSVRLSTHAAHPAGITAPPGDHDYGVVFGRVKILCVRSSGSCCGVVIVVVVVVVVVVCPAKQ